MTAFVRYSMFVIVLVVGISSTNADEPYVLRHSLQWHDQYVGEYLAELPVFDLTAATESAASKYPLLPDPPKSEFETQAEYNRRLDDVARKNVAIKKNRSEFIETRRQQFESRNAALRPKIEKAKKNQRQGFPQLLYTYPATAKRFDAETSTYPAFDKPPEALGDGNNGFADLKVDIKPAVFKCDDLALAKRIRAVSDARNLWVAIYISDATVSIERSSKVVDRGGLEKAGEILADSAPYIAAALLAEYFSPGSTRNVHIPQKDVAQTKTVFGYVLSVSGTDHGYAGIYDVGRNECLWQPK